MVSTFEDNVADDNVMGIALFLFNRLRAVPAAVAGFVKRTRHSLITRIFGSGIPGT